MAKSIRTSSRGLNNLYYRGVTPQQFTIPDAEDYNYLNITNFGGLSLSDNPFVVSSNTASDCLNVYVDEDNALSTRPRLANKYEKSLRDLCNLSSAFVFIGVYQLHDGYLIHGRVGNTYQMYKLNSATGDVITIKGDIPKNRCNIFEQNNAIYVLDGSSYKNILNGTISDVEGYVPTTVINKRRIPTQVTNLDDTTLTVDIGYGADYEQLNLLSDKYKESYFWDGTWNIEDVRMSPEDVIENNYVAEKSYTVKNIDPADRVLQYIKTVSEKAEDKNYFVMFKWSNVSYKQEFMIVTTDKDLNVITSEDKILSFPERAESYDYYTAICSNDGTTVVIAVTNPNVRNDDKIRIYRRQDVNSSSFTTYEITVPQGEYGDFNVTKLAINETGTIIVYLDPDDKGHVINFDGDKYVDAFISQSDRIRDLSLNDDGTVCVCHIASWSYDDQTDKIVRFDPTKTPIQLITIEDILPEYNDDVFRHTSFTVSPSGKSLIVEVSSHNLKKTNVVQNKLLYIANLEDKDSAVKIDANPVYDWQNMRFVFNETESAVYYINTGVGTEEGGIINLSKNMVLQDIYFPALLYGYPFIKNGTIVSTSYRGLCTNRLQLESYEPLLIVTRNIDTLDKEKRDLLIARRNQFYKALLNTRFNNNTWFASGDVVFYTAENNPAYIPITSYSELGDINDEITGFNLLQDEVLAVYKHNRIYTIRPATVANISDYLYTETKNVEGNDAIDAPIITTQTEMPIHISHNGIFALNQLQNVQSSDRIAVPISNTINKKWFSEDSKVIDKAKTLNRLYWTYIMLPYDDKTKVYLLDNRTAQWFYWELPISLLEAYVTENVIELVDTQGNLYYLTREDIINPRNPRVTEYYDAGKKLIQWFWQSQILSMNTLNYPKKLIDTTFVLSDSDLSDEYGLKYQFTAYRKSMSKTDAMVISDKLNYVRSVTKKTRIHRFNFVQIKLSNLIEDFNNNKLRLVGLGMKYTLLGGIT